jgi:hypothetical protein
VAAVAACALTAASAAAYPLLQQTAPALSIKMLKRPATYSRSATAGFAWKRVSAARTRCKLDTRKFAACRTSITYRRLKAGKHTFTVTVSHGGWTRTVKVRWTIDLTPPTAPLVTGGSASWVTTPPVLHASGSRDIGTGLAGYQHRQSSNGGLSWSAVTSGQSVTVTTSGSTWVQFRARDRAGNVSAWAPAAPDAASTALVDDTPPTPPLLTGGGATWVHDPQVDVTASGSVDLLSNPVSYEYRTSSDAGVTWTPWTAGTDAAVTAEGKTLVEFRALDALGNATAPVQTPVWIDRTPPADPVVSGGAAAWSSAASVKVTASGSTDATSGVAGYQYETSLNGAPFSPAQAGSSVSVTAEGQTTVQFQAIDKSGLPSGWVSTQVWLDRTPPSLPVLSGGSSGWQNVASVAITASGSSDGSGSGLAAYQSETSTDNGHTWSPAVPGATATVTAEGQTLVRFRAVDALGNASTWAQSVAMIDRTPPTDPAISGVPGGWVNATSVTATASSTDSPGSGIQYYLSQQSIDNGAHWSPAVQGPSVTITGEGQTLVQFQAVDNSGQHSGWTTATVSIDRTPPSAVTGVTGGTGGRWVDTTPVTVTSGGATDPLSGVSLYQYRTSTDGGQTWSAAATGTSDGISAQGTTIVQFRAVDGAGNAGPWSPSTPDGTDTVQIDLGKPTAPSVSGGSLTWSPAASTTISASGSTDSLSGLPAGADYESRTSTDGGTTWTSASPAGPGSLIVSAEGETLVQFRAVDAAGNVSAWAPAASGAANTVRLDHTAPSVPNVSGGSSTWLNAASTKITASGSTDTGGSGFSGYQYRTSPDGTNWTSATAGSSVTVTAEGETDVEFRSVDNAGNRSAWSAVTAASTVLLDRTAPSVPSVSGGSASWSNAASVTVSGGSSTDPLSGMSGYQYETSFNNGAWSAPVAGASAPVSAEGTTTLRFRAIDNAGNSSAWTTVGPSATVKLDRTLPSMPNVSGGSAAWSNAASVSIAAAGSTDALSGLAGYQYETSLNGGAWSSPATPGASAPVSAEGTTTVRFQAIDNAGNTSAWTTVSAASTVNLDRTPPTAAGAAGGSLTWQNVASITVSGSGETDALSGIASYQYRTSTDGGTTWSAAATGTSVTISSEGQTMVEFRATDTAGNAGAWAPAPGTAGATVRIDRSVPSAPAAVSGGSLSWTNAGTVTISASGATDAVSGVAGYQSRTSTNGGSSWGNWSATGAGTLGVTAAGTTVVQFRAVDMAGNVSAATPAANGAANTVNIDRTLPTAPTVSGGSSWSWSTAASKTITATGSTDSGGSGLAGYQYQTSLNGGAWSTAVSGSSAVITAEGTTTVQFRSVDNAGNVSAWTTVGSNSTVKLDRTAPTVPTVSGGSLTCTSSRIRISASGSTDAASGVARYQYHYSTNGGAFGSTMSGTSVSFSSKGTYVVQFQAVDRAGNVSAWGPVTAGAANTACHS